MGKIADRYFKVNPWKIIEEGYDKNHNQVSESIFSLANEYMGIRGYFEEGVSADSLKGFYFNGIYEREKKQKSGYKGIVDSTEFMVNSLDPLLTKVDVVGEELDLGKCQISDYIRELDMRSGLVTRSFIWHLSNDRDIRVSFRRIISMEEKEVMVQQISLEPINFNGRAEVEMDSSFDTMQVMYQKKYWDTIFQDMEEDLYSIGGKTKTTGFELYSTARILVDKSQVTDACNVIQDDKLGKRYALWLEAGKPVDITKVIINVMSKEENEAVIKRLNRKGVSEKLNLDTILDSNKKWWEKVWDQSDISIKGDDENQQGIRFCIFQLFQTYNGAREGDNIGAKGLTGEAYNGNAFWDTETYCLPFYIFNNLKAAKSLLMFRKNTLKEAKDRAKQLDLQGAFYPIATISGRECCDLWQHASLQLQASTAVAYGIWFYEKMTDDREFLLDSGLELLIEICRMLATRGDWDRDHKTYGFFNVMGPDEFQMMVNNNCYTNYMGKFTFEYTLRVIGSVKGDEIEKYRILAKSLGLSDKELKDWREKAKAMLILQDKESKIYEQHEGFFKLPHLDIDTIPVEDFPLYSHWSYDRIYRNDMIKQPDVLMLMLLFNSRFTQEELRANYEYYEPRCIHESSLSPSVHSILACQLKKFDEAYDFFSFATRMDLDNYNRNSHEGIHTTSIAAAWMNIVYGFAGFRSDGEEISLCPTLPRKWQGYSFRLTIDGKVLNVEVTGDKVILDLSKGELTINIYGKKEKIGKETLTLEIPDMWKGK
ncbi:MAG: family 65 glycosyl hydrolase [Pseudobutyrivibrio sp.]|nr:family 65 glycosyl hydrolase [Pseudobutyrivibrio sp.]